MTIFTVTDGSSFACQKKKRTSGFQIRKYTPTQTKSRARPPYECRVNALCLAMCFHHFPIHAANHRFSPVRPIIGDVRLSINKKLSYTRHQEQHNERTAKEGREDAVLIFAIRPPHHESSQLNSKGRSTSMRRCDLS